MSRQGFSHTDASLRNIAQQLLDHARAGGASAAEVDVSEGFGQSVTVRRGEVETIEYNRDKGIGVTVYVGQRRGYASSSDFSLDAMRATVDAALSIARFSAASLIPPGPFSTLARASTRLSMNPLKSSSRPCS